MNIVAPLACQRHAFEIPDHVSYLDAAAWTPLPRQVRAAGETGMLGKSRPWAYPRTAAAGWAERARAAAARLVGAETDDIAIVGSISHAMATAAHVLVPEPGSRILRVADEFPSQCLPWDKLAVERDLVVDIVARPSDGDWTAALLEAIGRPGAAPLGIATLTPMHWSDGALIDLDRLAPAVHAAGAALVVDGTQAVGAMPIDVSRLKPDFLAFPTYKWLLGPYSLAFFYAAPHRQDGFPLEMNAGNRPPVDGARRYDKGELNDPILLPMAATGMELIIAWGVPSITARLRHLTTLLAEGLSSMGLQVLPQTLRSPNILGVRLPVDQMPHLIERLRAEHVFASERLGGLRLSPHVWVNEADVSQCLSALRAILRCD